MSVVTSNYAFNTPGPHGEPGKGFGQTKISRYTMKFKPDGTEVTELPTISAVFNPNLLMHDNLHRMAQFSNPKKIMQGKSWIGGFGDEENTPDTKDEDKEKNNGCGTIIGLGVPLLCTLVFSI